MKLFDLREAGPTAGDCTAPYDVTFHRECTVQEFIDEVLKQREWGFINICDCHNSSNIYYENDKIVSGNFDTDLLNARIKKATAHGGWSRMDYWLDILTDEQKFRNDYAQILTEISRHESEIVKLKRKARDIEAQLESIDGTKAEKTQPDKDGCMY